MELEDKAKVVASDWGAEFVKFLAALAVLPRSVCKKWLNSSTFQIDRGKQMNKLCPPNRRDATTFAIFFSLHPSSMMYVYTIQEELVMQNEQL